MPASDKSIYDEALLTRYLLGELPAEQAEKLDELSIVDEEFAWRLRAAEDDLVDTYVRGTLADEELKKFRASYLSSPARRHKAEFAAALLELGTRSATQAARSAEKSSPWRSLFGQSRPLFQWAMAGAALLLMAAAFLVVDDIRLRREMHEAAQNNSSAREQQLEQQLNQQRAEVARMEQELERARQATPDLSQVTTVALMLEPPTRGLARPVSLTVHPGTSLVALLLELESDDFARYRVSVKDPETRQELWHSADLAASSAGGHRAVTASVPANLLKQQKYIVQLSGVQKDGVENPVADYLFGIVLK